MATESGGEGRAGAIPARLVVGGLGLLLLLLLPVGWRGWADWCRAREVRRAVEQHEERALAALAAGDHSRALLALEAARELDPSSPELQREVQETRILAVALRPEALSEGGLDALGYALEVVGPGEGTPDAAVRLVAAGHLALRTEGAGRARELYEQAIAARPGFAPAHFFRGNLLRLDEDRIEAAKAFEAAVAADPEYVEATHNLGTLYVELGRVEEGLAMLGRAIGIRDNATSRLSLATALAGVERLPEAVEHLEQAVRLAPRSPVVFRRAGALLLEGGRYDEAERLLRRSLELRDDPATAFSLGRVYQAQRRFDRATELFARVSRSAEDDPEVAYQLAESLRGLGRDEEAAAVFRRYLELASPDPQQAGRAERVRELLGGPGGAAPE